MEKQYTNGTVTIVWKPDLCEHSGNCFGNLPDVFNPRINPWIKPENASSSELIEVVRACPSGALTILGDSNDETSEPLAENAEKNSVSELIPAKNVTVKVTHGGPYMITGVVTIKHHDGTITERNSVTALCRCGQSTKKPFCDGSHVKSNLDKTTDK
ncbi:MAG: (4Fe-4S)-binding protein [Ignavibacteria bacterium]|nr:(4Fe-4S)-binding protein [Ignavibacteria bacterium]